MSSHTFEFTDTQEQALEAARNSSGAVDDNGELIQFDDNQAYLNYVLERAIESYARQYNITL